MKSMLAKGPVMTFATGMAIGQGRADKPGNENGRACDCDRHA